MIIAQLCLAGIAFAAPPRLSPALVRRTQAAVDAVLSRPVLSSKARIRTVEAAMAHVHRGLDAYFHAPNLLEARADALAMRVVFRSMRQGEKPAMILVDDVLRFAADLHDELAQACEALADQGCALRHRLLALASGPSTPTRVEAARRLLPPKDRAIFDERRIARTGATGTAPVNARSGAPASPRE